MMSRFLDIRSLLGEEEIRKQRRRLSISNALWDQIPVLRENSMKTNSLMSEVVFLG